MPDLSARQQVEGYASTVSHPGQYPSFAHQRARLVADYRGPGPQALTREWWRDDDGSDPPLEWLTAQVPEAVDTAFSFAGTSAALPDDVATPNEATLYANDEPVITFELGLQVPGAWVNGDWALEFIPKQVRSGVDGYHRQFDAAGCSGLYRLGAPAGAITAGEPLRLRVALAPSVTAAPNWFAVMERTDILAVTPETNLDEIEQLQHEVIRLKQTVAGLARRAYPEIFPDRLATVDTVIHADQWRHVHPPDVLLLDNGDLLVAFREAREHLASGGRIVTVRSTDGGLTWGDKTVAHEAADTDVRDASLAQIRDGSLLLNDFVNPYYDSQGHYMGRAEPSYRGQPGGTYVGKSTDAGKSWTWLTSAPIEPAPFQFLGTSERIVELPSGELVMATYFVDNSGEALRRGSALHRSSDGGATWAMGAIIGEVPGLWLNEPALLRTSSGRLLAILRCEQGPAYYQSVSDDDGQTWSGAVQTVIPGRANPASLVQLEDGTILCVYGARHDVRGMYVVASYDDGETWDISDRRVIRDDFPNWDIGYPSSALLPDCRVMAVYYFNMFDRYVVMASTFRWERPATAG
jgi:hypothetical protein